MFATSQALDASTVQSAVDGLRQRLLAHYSGADSTRTVQALDFARSSCQLAQREAELVAACDIASLLLDLDLDPDTVAVALISRTLPADQMDAEALTQAFGPEVVDLLKGLQRAGQIESFSRGQVSVEA